MYNFNNYYKLLLRVLLLLLLLRVDIKVRLHEPSRDGAGLMVFYVTEQVGRPHLLGVRGVEVEIYGGVGPGVPHYAAVPCRVSL